MDVGSSDGSAGHDAGADRVVIAQIDPPGGTTVYAISDIHGGYDRVAALLEKNGILSALPQSPGTPQWGAGNALLVVAGDLIDKGPQPIEVIDFLMALETAASAAGGRVVVLLGNHEAEFFVNPTNSKATATDGVDQELAARGIAPAAVADGTDPRGAWLRKRPIGARVGKWFFSHAGNTKGRTLSALDAALRAALDAHSNYDDPELVGVDSILEARDWYTNPTTAPANAKALGVSHIVFGHQPSALGPKGAIATAQSGALFRIDCGMSPLVNDSTGCILRIRHLDANTEVADGLDATGGAPITLWQGP
ncbi:putative serine/threonine phosphatase [Labilithrix luteola]|uniref:Putative serine/threonine phosphatase n=1 Tax=Labilithrix luteola TaxID=1391654 RepID=A0A0K1PSI1_9BACT|nr:putative serine/threonine phosphatase [Labilithrix luteola]